LGSGENAIKPNCLWLLTVFVKKSYLSSWVFTAMQSVHIRMNSSLSPPLKNILDPPMGFGQLCPTQMAYWAKNYVTDLPRAAH